MEYIMIHGGNKNTVFNCAMGGWYYGYQFGSTCYGLPYMIDYTGDGSDWDAYITTLKHERPRQALVADFRKAAEWQMVVQRMLDVAELGIRPVVVAKFKGALRLIPQTVLGMDSIIGVSVPTKRGYMNDGSMPTVDEFQQYSACFYDSKTSKKRDIHLLGGHPDTWLFLKQYYQDVANLHSVDGNVLYEQAWMGKLWSRHGKYRQLPRMKYSTNAITICSLRNVPRYMATNHYYMSQRIVRCKVALGLAPKQQELFAA